MFASKQYGLLSLIILNRIERLGGPSTVLSVLRSLAEADVSCETAAFSIYAGTNHFAITKMVFVLNAELPSILRERGADAALISGMLSAPVQCWSLYKRG